MAKSTTMPIVASTLNQQRCLVISSNGDCEKLQGLLAELSLVPLPAGTGREGVGAIEHFNPGVIILFFHAKDEQDALVLRAIQSLWREKPVSPIALIISTDIRMVKKMLGRSARNRRCGLLSEPSDDLVKQTMAALSKQQRPRKAAKAAP